MLLHAPALVDDLNAPPPDVGHQRRALERDRGPTRLLRLADGTRLKGRPGLSGFQLVLWNEEGIALAITEPVEDRRAQTVRLCDPLD